MKKYSQRMIRAPLIDRLIDDQPEEIWEDMPLRALDRAEFRKSVMRDLGWLLNTRITFAERILDERKLSVVHYGIPDFCSYSPASLADQELLVKRIKRCMEIFEPRLSEVKIEVNPEITDVLLLKIDSVLVMDSVSEPVSFRTVFNRNTGAWEIHEQI